MTATLPDIWLLIKSEQQSAMYYETVIRRMMVDEIETNFL